MFQSWRDLLKGILSSGREKQRLARALGVSPATLRAWAKSEADPQVQQLYLLINALPKYRQQLLESITEEMERGDGRSAPVIEIGEIPSVFYAHVLSGSTVLTPPVRFWSLANMILNQGLSQMGQQGIALQVAHCMPPGSERRRVRSLRLSVSVSTAPWRGEGDQQVMLLGAESLAGWSVMARRLMVANGLAEREAFPPLLVPREASVAAYPIERANRVAGCLLIASTQAEFFSPTRLMLLRHYANLLSLAFEQEEFYASEDLDLQIMPKLDAQLSWRAAFQRRVADTLAQEAQISSMMDVAQAEMSVWRQYEEEFLRITSS